ncbi:MAG: hypothetical protein AAGC93_08075 [Cyanobacteria bacterium P01_F01_bin.53]
MPFTISPTEAQAIQEDEVQLLNAIAQIAQRIPGVFQSTSTTTNGNGQQPTDALRIKMGRRLVYGQLADGPFRHELDANTLKVITDALQQPVTPNIEPAQYARKVPAIEIFHGDVLLFREERDGTITTNDIYFQVEQAGQQSQDEPSATVPESPIPEPPIVDAPKGPSISARAELAESTTRQTTENAVTATQAAQFAQGARDTQLITTAEYLLNPLRQPNRIYDEVSVQGYKIQQKDSEITISQGERVVLRAQKGELVSNHVTEQDWSTLSQMQVPERLSQPILNGLPKAVINETPINEIPSNETPLTHNGATQNRNGSEATPALSEETPALSALVTQGRESENIVKLSENHSAIAVLARESQNLPEGNTRQLLQATLQDWQQQVSQRFSSRLQEGTTWLANQQTALQNQRLAHAVHRLFQRGYERTGEHSYHVRGCTIKRRGQNLYVLKDAVGELMKFETSKIMGFGRRMTVLSVSDRLTHHQRQNLMDNQLDSSVMPQGSLDVEAAYAAKTQKVEATVRQFLTNFAHAHTWDRENGQFKLEIGEGDTLRITDKQDGRGVVFERNNGEVSSKLGGQDFGHFDRLSAKMQTMKARQSQSAVNNGSNSGSNSGSKKSQMIEMD